MATLREVSLEFSAEEPFHSQLEFDRALATWLSRNCPEDPEWRNWVIGLWTRKVDAWGNPLILDVTNAEGGTLEVRVSSFGDPRIERKETATPIVNARNSHSATIWTREW